MIQNLFLTQEELTQLTGFKKTSKQLKWLLENNFSFVIGGDGSPRVLYKHMEIVLGGIEHTKRSPTIPNFEALIHG